MTFGNPNDGLLLLEVSALQVGRPSLSVYIRPEPELLGFSPRLSPSSPGAQVSGHVVAHVSGRLADLGGFRVSVSHSARSSGSSGLMFPNRLLLSTWE